MLIFNNFWRGRKISSILSVWQERGAVGFSFLFKKIFVLFLPQLK